MPDPDDLPAGEQPPRDRDTYPLLPSLTTPAAAEHAAVPPRDSRPAGFYPHPYQPGREIWWDGESWSGKTPDDVYTEERNEILQGLPVIGGVVRFVNGRPPAQLYALGLFLLLPTIIAFGTGQRGLVVLLLFLILCLFGSKRVAIWRSSNPKVGDRKEYSDSYSADRLRQPM